MFDTKGILHNVFVFKKAYDVLWNTISEKYGLTRAEIDVLAFLANHPELNTARDIVQFRQIAKSHVSKAVDNLITRGLLRGEQAADDRRCIRLLPTASAGEILEAIRESQCAFAKSLLADFTEEELRQFESMNMRICENAEKMLYE